MAAESAHEYFRAIEETFIRLRGAPLLLSPADWQTARAWREAGIPLRLVERVMEEVFDRLRERDPERRIQGLRYCAAAVEEAWREVRNLGATAGRLEPVPVDVRRRLAELAAALPDELPRRGAVATALAELDGDAEAVEARLQAIEEQYLEQVLAELPEAERQRLHDRVARALDRTRSRLDGGSLERLEGRLRREYTRQHLGLAPLSLFVEPGDHQG
jgi:hypothetical protein